MFKVTRTIGILAILTIFNLATTRLLAQTDSCLSEINGALKGGPGNVQDNTFHSLFIDPTNENVVYVGTEANGIFKTTNAGSSWIRLRRGLKCTSNQTGYSQIFDITADPSNTSILYASAVNGPGPAAGPLYPSSSGGVYKSTNGGQTWFQKVNGFTNTYASYVVVDPTNPSRLYAGIGGLKSSFVFTKDSVFEGGIYESVDAGEHWSLLPVPTAFKKNIIIDMVLRGSNPSFLYASGQIHGQDADSAVGLIKSTDNGRTWQVINPSGATINGFDVYPKNPLLIYGHDLTASRRVHKSTDGGASWTVVQGVSFFGVIRFHPTDSLTLFFTGFHEIKRSKDGMKTFTTVSDDTALASFQQMTDIKISASNPNVVWAAAKGYYVYRSTDGGNNWTKITAVRDSVYRGVATSASEQSCDCVTEFRLHENYPNPFNAGTVLGYDLPISSYVSLKVFDVVGRLVATIVEGEQAAGHHVLSWQSTLPSGTYFLHLDARDPSGLENRYASTKKIILLR